MSEENTPMRSRFTAFAFLFLVSGACGLIYEVVWTRLLVSVFGVTGFAVSTVLVAFMGGLALGAAILGGRADRVRRPLRLFAVLEGGVACCALAMPFVLNVTERIYDAFAPGLPDTLFAQSLLRFALCGIVLVIPTAMMGGTLPALGRGLLGTEGPLGRGIALLYCINTAGAAAGCYVAGFHLIPALGLHRTTWLAAVFSTLVAVAAWLLDAPVEPVPVVTRAATERARPPLCTPRIWPLVVACGSGFAALAFEVAWFRLLVMVFGSTAYSFSAMLAVFLFGLALGSFALAPWADRATHPVRLLAGLQGLAAAAVLIGHVSVNGMPHLFLTLLPTFGFSFAGMNATKLVMSILTILPAALAFGGTFPLVVRIADISGVETGGRIARVYAWNTVGAILGSFGAGFLLLPAIGAERTLQLVVAISLILSVGTILAERGRLSARWAAASGALAIALAAALLLSPRWDRRLLGVGVYFEPGQFVNKAGDIALDRIASEYKLMTYTEGYSDTILSFLSPKGKFITVNGSPTASDQMDDMVVQRALGHLPAALRSQAKGNALVVGLGVGVTAGTIALYDGIEHVKVVELERGVFEACRFFSKENHGVLDNKKVSVRIDDARGYLRTTRESFDLISSEPNFPSLSGAGQLYNADFLRLCRRRLAPGGTMCHWSPLWRLDPQEVKRIVATFEQVFPHVRVFSSGMCLVLLGREKPFPPVDLPELTRRVGQPAVAASLLEIGIRGPLELLSLFVLDDGPARRYAAGIAPSSDDRPYVEYNAPRWLFANSVGPNLDAIGAFRSTPEERAELLGVPEAERDSFAAIARQADASAEGQVLIGRGEIQKAIDALAPAADAGHRYARFTLANQAVRIALNAQEQGDLRGAKQWFAYALQYEPERLEALVGLGYVDLFLEDHDEAERVLTEAARLYPRSAGATYRLGILREMQGRQDDAEKLFRAAIETEPLLGAPHALLGSILLPRGEAAQALAQFDEAIRLGEPTEGAVTGRCEAMLALGRGAEALACAKAAAFRFASSADAFAILARAAKAQGRQEEAAAAQARRAQILKAPR